MQPSGPHPLPALHGCSCTFRSPDVKLLPLAARNMGHQPFAERPSPPSDLQRREGWRVGRAVRPCWPGDEGWLTYQSLWVHTKSGQRALRASPSRSQDVPSSAGLGGKPPHGRQDRGSEGAQGLRGLPRPKGSRGVPAGGRTCWWRPRRRVRPPWRGSSPCSAPSRCLLKWGSGRLGLKSELSMLTGASRMVALVTGPGGRGGQAPPHPSQAPPHSKPVSAPSHSLLHSSQAPPHSKPDSAPSQAPPHPRQAPPHSKPGSAPSRAVSAPSQTPPHPCQAPPHSKSGSAPSRSVSAPSQAPPHSKPGFAPSRAVSAPN